MRGLNQSELGERQQVRHQCRAQSGCMKVGSEQARELQTRHRQGAIGVQRVARQIEVPGFH